MIRLLILASLTTVSLAVPVDFAEDVRPLLNKHCVSCHGGVKMASDLSLLTFEQATAKAKSGLAAIVPHQPEDSEMLHRIASDDEDERMPPPEHGPALTAAEQETLKQWISEGATWKKHWAFEPPVRVDARDSINYIDAIVRERLTRESLTHAHRAEPTELLRRVTLDLTGLPPSAEALAAFLKDSSEEAYADVVDALLNSPHFGERWASVWMDVARYADSEGLGIDGRRNVWKYRDWLIDAFNEDKPYDDFIVEQLAGDLIPNATIAQQVATTFHRLTQSNNEGGTDDEEFRVLAVMDRVSTTWEALQGVTFGCVQCHSHPYDPFQHKDYYSFMAFFNNSADADLGEGFPDLSVPLDKNDEVEMADILRRQRALRVDIHSTSDALTKATNWQAATFTEGTSSTGTGIALDGEEFQATGNLAVGTQFSLDFKVPGGLQQITALRIDLLPKDPVTAAHTPEWGTVLSRIMLEQQGQGSDHFSPVALREVLADEAEPFYDPNASLAPGSRGVGPYSKQFRPRHCVVVLEKPIKVSPGSTLRLKLKHDVFALGAFPLVTQRGRVSLTDQLAWTHFSDSPEITNKRRALAYLNHEAKAIRSTSVPVMQERPAHLQRETRLFERGNWLAKGDAMQPNVPASFPPLADGQKRDRLALAQWFVSPKNPLTARVMVNRLWEQLFGRGIVLTLEDFGSAGEKPSHPELLDHLAIRFQQDLEWSVKSILREIILSETYQQTAKVGPQYYDSDPANRLLARGPRQRLTAEMVRDHALSVAGLFSPKLHGPPVHPPLPAGVWTPFSGEKWNTAKPDNSDRYRRSLYVFVKRSIPFPTFATFDAPSREICQQRRLPSNTPLQALTLFNDEVFVECARSLAARMAAHSDDVVEQLRHGHLLATSSVPDVAALEELSSLYQRLRNDDSASAQDALAVIASVLINLDAALTK